MFIQIFRLTHCYVFGKKSFDVESGVAIDQEDGGWWEGTLDGKTGWFPSNYVKEMDSLGLQNFDW